MSVVALVTSAPTDTYTLLVKAAIEGGGANTCTLVTDAAAPGTDFVAGGYETVAFYRSALGSSDLLSIRAQGVPILATGNRTFLVDFKLVEYGADISSVSSLATTPRLDHPINDGFTLDSAYTVINSGSVYFAFSLDAVGPPAYTWAGDAIQSIGADRYKTMFAANAGESDLDGNPLEARAVTIGWLTRFYTSLTGDAQTMIQQAIEWLTDPNIPEGGTVGDAPNLTVGAVGAEAALLAVDPLSEYLEVMFYLYEGAAALPPVSQTGSDRHTYAASSLSAETTYTAYANVRYAGGWSPISNSVTFTTRAVDWNDDGSMGCPPAYPSVIINPDGNPPNRLGVGFFTPKAGEPMRGVVTVIFRWLLGGVPWDFYLSDDLGVSWSKVADDVISIGTDGDLLVRYTFDLDTTIYSDGLDYRLKAVDSDGNEDDVVSLSFAIDNAEEVYWWRQSYDDLDGRFGKVWAQEGENLYGIATGDEIWYRSRDGGLAALKGHDWAMLADLDCPPTKGGDVTIRFYVWSGEGGWQSLQGRDDTEGIYVGIGFFGGGVTEAAQEGLFLGIENLVSWVLGCCNNYLTSSAGAALYVASALNAGDPFTHNDYGSQVTENPIEKMWFKATSLPPHTDLTPEELARWPLMWWRDGPNPGEGLVAALYSCGRRYEAYTLRVRAEVQAGDDTALDVKLRLDGIGVTEPDAGYWHVEETFSRPDPWPCGLLGMVSKQIAASTYGTPAGARVFQTWSAYPLDPTCSPVEVAPIEPEWWNPPQQGQPCTLVLQVFEEDRQRVAWEVGTDTYHDHPYLCVPEHYGEQEIDVVNGAATIGQVEVVVVDKNQTVGDQDSGWMTERLSAGGVQVIHGRRCRLLRYIDHERGWVVIADGPASTPRIDESYAAFRWTIRDTRETERKVKGFVRADSSWLLPMGVPDGFGSYTDDDGNAAWLVPPTSPLVGNYVYAGGPTDLGSVVLSDYWTAVPPGSGPVTEEVVVSADVESALLADAEELGDPRPVLWTWPNLEVLWRLEGSSSAWNVVDPTDLFVEGRTMAKPVGAGRWWRTLATVFDAELADGTEVRAAYGLMIRGVEATGTFPNDGERVEVAIRWKGEPTEFAPLHIEHITTGQLLKKLYDGEFSRPDPVTGDFVATGIRYAESDLLEMNDPVLLRITKAVTDVRSWAEKFAFAPTGWCPALDNDGRISPVSQVPPDDFSGLTDINNAITEPVPEWDAGERVVNVLRITYPRWYRLNVEDATAVDRLKEREVTHEYRSESSITNHGEQVVELDASAFSAIGDTNGKPIKSLTDEKGYLLAQDRRLYVFDRYQNGAASWTVPVMREMVATLRAGSWVTTDLSWMPDYLTQRRGLVTGGQVLAIYDVDCAWRILLIEEVLPQDESS